MAHRLRSIDGPDKGISLEFSSGKVTIGRNADCTMCLAKDGSASRLHAGVEVMADGSVFFHDLSTGGSLVNGRPVRQTTLVGNEKLLIGSNLIEFTIDRKLAKKPAEETAKPPA
jgi:predicted component of type VI protein secretion system